MLATRIIPTLCCRGRELVKGERFNSWRPVGHVLQAARIHGMRQVDELVLLDIAATPQWRKLDFDLIAELALNMTTPLAVGGGISTLEDIDHALRNGADKVVIGTAAGTDLVSTAAKHFGSQAIVVAIDAKGLNVWVHCGRVPLKGPGGAQPVTAGRWAKICEDEGAGEILLTSIDREGGMGGYDLDLIRSVNGEVDIPVVAHGGCGSFDHMLEALRAGAHAVAAGAFFQFTDNTPADAARYLHEHGIEVRLPKAVPA